MCPNTGKHSSIHYVRVLIMPDLVHIVLHSPGIKADPSTTLIRKYLPKRDGSV